METIHTYYRKRQVARPIRGKHGLDAKVGRWVGPLERLELHKVLQELHTGAYPEPCLYHLAWLYIGVTHNRNRTTTLQTSGVSRSCAAIIGPPLAFPKPSRYGQTDRQTDKKQPRKWTSARRVNVA
jgi:hypothetical protein